MPRKTSVTALLALILTIILAPGARALFASGACVFTLRFDFDTRVRSAADQLTNPDYTVTGGAPIDPMQEACAIPISTLDPLRNTGVIGYGDSTIWTCESAVAGGSWDQGWEGAIPSINNGAHKVTGTWGAWELALWDLNPPAYVGTAILTVHPDDATKLATCESLGIRSLRMVGVLVFQDP